MPPHPAPADTVDEWRTAGGDRIVVRLAFGTVCCDPLVGELLDAVAPPPRDPARGLRPSRHYLLGVDGRDHIVVIATRIDGNGEERPIALARCVRLGGSSTAVPSLVVAAGLRGRGIGTRLLGTLCRVARARGVQRLHLDLARDGGPALDLLRMLRSVAALPVTAHHGVPRAIEVPLLVGESAGARTCCAID